MMTRARRTLIIAADLAGIAALVAAGVMAGTAGVLAAIGVSLLTIGGLLERRP